MALEYISRAKRTLEEASSAFRQEDYALTIRRAQETAELSLKAVLRFLALEYPKEHDVRDVLLVASGSRMLPEWFQSEVESMADASSDLARKRGPALYGDEQAMRPPSQLFSRDDAAKAIEDAERIHRNCDRLIRSKGETSESGV